MEKEFLNQRYKLFACCIPVKGYYRSGIVDINRHKIHIIPHSLFYIIKRYKSKAFSEILKNFNEDETAILIEYLDFLKKNEIVFPVHKEEINRFPTLPLHWDFPSNCSNAILDLGIKSNSNYINCLSQLNKINCFHLQIRLLDIIEIPKIHDMLTHASSLSFHTIQLIIDYRVANSEDFFKDLMKQYWKLSKIEVFNAPMNKFSPVVEPVTLVIFHERKSLNITQCGNIDQRYFSIEMNHFTEAQHFNTCLNRKLCIDENGEVKNCPSMSRNFGHIDNVDLKDIISNPDFTGIWSIRKDDIDVCKDCEFRYVCTDCRCFIKDLDNIYSQPAKCKYNPYIAKWEGEQDYITVEKWREENPTWEKGIKRYPLVKNPQKIDGE
ncbi:MAG: grasp-with-spasm system SPASM domain peptide maturase [Tannerella sp.]|jgi:SPASM domain peptide maturase of grasp-with-spasm system|nr:grasp-with-spasm system SPASM domain peptide maturase [Tannerella sp.]